MAGSGIVHEAASILAAYPGTVAAAVAVLAFLVWFVYVPLVASPLRSVPGPASYALTKWRLALDDWRGTRTRSIHALHARYGPAVRIGPNEISFSSLAALRTIYGAGSGFERTAFYRMFDVYGRQNLFTFAEVKKHAARKKLLAHAYSKTTVLSPQAMAKPLIEANVKSFLDLVEQEMRIAGQATHSDNGNGPKTTIEKGSSSVDQEIFTSLHWFSLDSITGFLYGDRHGGTHALRGDAGDRLLLTDILDPSRRKLTWFVVHLRAYTAWLYSRTGVCGRLVDRLGLLPMQKPTTYTGIRAHALRAWEDFQRAQTPDAADTKARPDDDLSIMGKLYRHSVAGTTTAPTSPPLQGLDIASEAADHLLAGIDTTSDTLMFILWALSLPQHAADRARLIAEVDAIPAAACNADGHPVAEHADTLPFLNAVIKEALRLYAPLPASEPRAAPVDTIIDGHRIPAGTVVGMSPYTLHRNAEVFPEPLAFRPERWLEGHGTAATRDERRLGDLGEMKKWFWAFSSGGRMCIGLHLAMAEMTTLLAALYRTYTTELPEKQAGVSPGITSRFEVFADETFGKVREHECWVRFRKRS